MICNPHAPMRRTRPTATARDAGWYTVRAGRPGRANQRLAAIAESAGIR